MPPVATAAAIAAAPPDDADAGFPAPTSLECSDGCESGLVPPARYCPTELLGSFTLLMAGHGRCVSSAMMLGDREYALWQLARARAFGDAQLRELATQLFTWFDSRDDANAGHASEAAL